MTIRDLPGKRFGLWTVLDRSHKNHALCRCECGTEKHIPIGNLNNGASRSCGCAKRGVTSDLPQTIKMRDWRKANPTKAKAQRDQQTRTGRRPVRYTKPALWALYESQCGRCAYCLETLGGRFETDHVVPTSQGGANSLTNIVCVCAACNRLKGEASLLQFFLKFGRAA